MTTKNTTGKPKKKPTKKQLASPHRYRGLDIVGLLQRREPFDWTNAAQGLAEALAQRQDLADIFPCSAHPLSMDDRSAGVADFIAGVSIRIADKLREAHAERFNVVPAPAPAAPASRRK